MISNKMENLKKKDVKGLSKLLTTTNYVKCIRIIPQFNLFLTFIISKKIIFSRINKSRYSFSKILEMGISFISFQTEMTY